VSTSQTLPRPPASSPDCGHQLQRRQIAGGSQALAHIVLLTFSVSLSLPPPSAIWTIAGGASGFASHPVTIGPRSSLRSSGAAISARSSSGSETKASSAAFGTTTMRQRLSSSSSPQQVHELCFEHDIVTVQLDLGSGTVIMAAKRDSRRNPYVKVRGMLWYGRRER